MFAPSRGRELKSQWLDAAGRGAEVRPLAGAGIEMSCGNGLRQESLFAPSRGRELKFTFRDIEWKLEGSPPRGGGN